MKFGINTLLFAGTFTDEDASLFPLFKEAGFEGVEIALEKKGDIDYGRILETLRANDLVCSSICGLYGPNRDLRGEKPEYVRNSIEYMKDCIDACVALGTNLVVGPHYSAVGRADLVPDEERLKQWKMVVRGLKEIGAYAEDRGVYLALEPLNRFETDFLNVCADALRLIKDVGSPMLKIHLDTFHMNIEEKSSAQAVLQAGDLLAMLHASENDRGAPGTGQVHWQAVAEAVRKIGYHGWVVVESFTPEVKVIAKAASIWRQTEKDGMTLAKKGLEFLKKTFV
jgi:D-psicose/D-tagatose/L-ribulose 3-epimerase